jgi:heme/copper-type cytochrome/quinol oxidase subunit 1
VYGPVPDVRSGVEALNAASAIGALFVAIAALLAIAATLQALGRSHEGEDGDLSDPWGGHTLEWATTSPPAGDNFPDGVPVVTSATPLFHDDGSAPDAPAEEEAP